MRRLTLGLGILLALTGIAATTISVPFDTDRAQHVGGGADEIQLKVKANASQSASLVTFEKSDGTDVWTCDKVGNVVYLGATTGGGAATFADDVTVSDDTTGGNAGAKTEIIGLPRIKLVSLGTGTNGSTETTSYVDDTPTGEYAPVDSDVTESNETTYYRFGTASYKAAFASTATAGDGFKRTITGDNLEANESIGLWIRASEACASGDLQILLTDDGGARNFNIPALSANVWTWVEVDISSLAAGTGDTVTEFGVTLTTAGATAHGAFNVWLDQAWKWDSTDEEALGAAIHDFGVLSVVKIATAAGTANTPTDLTEGTDYFVHYESGSDFIVWVTDQSAGSTVALIAY